MNIYDVSKRAGVSIATVSRVLNGNPNVSEKTRTKVLTVMAESGYTPNVFARGLGLGTMKTIGIMCSDSSDPYLANAIYHLERQLRSHGYDSLLCCTGIPRKIYEAKKYTLTATFVLVLLFWACVYCMYLGLDDPFLYYQF